MIRLLRHMSLLLWGATLAALPGSVFILPGLIRLFPRISPLVVFLTLTGLILVLMAAILDFTAKKIIAALIREGQAWERGGIVNKAAKKYIRAVRIYDSFMLFPFAAAGTTLMLTGTIARFGLTAGQDQDNFRLAACEYLKKSPGDKDLALLWLKRIRKAGPVFQAEQDLLSVLARVHDSDPDLSPLMADLFVELEQRDFTARTLVEKTSQMPGMADKYADSLAAMADDGADLDSAFQTEPQDGDFVKGGPSLGEVYHAQDAGIETATVSSPVPVRQPRSPARAGLRIQGLTRELRLSERLGSLIRKSVQMLVRGLSICLIGTARAVTTGCRFLVFQMLRLVGFIREREQVRFYLKTVVLAFAAAWLFYFMVGTISHLFKPKPPEVVKKQVAPVATPFTIQVAAYVKQAHADRYVAILKKKGLSDVRVKKVAGGGKTWFVVRISQFETKQGAAEFGRDLKARKIIDDYFVNNN